MRRAERSQALVEFAVVAPVLLLLTFGIIDFGRALFYYVTVQQAAREGARAVVKASTPLPSNADIQSIVSSQSFGIVTAAPCYNGPITAATPPPNRAWVFVTEPNPPASIEGSPPPDAPGGEPGASASGSCSAINPAQGNDQLQVTVIYTYAPVTPLVSGVIGNLLTFRAVAIYRTEY